MCYKRFKSEQCLLILKREAHFFLQALSRHSDQFSQENPFRAVASGDLATCKLIALALS